MKSKNKRPDLKEEIEIPEGVNARIEDHLLKIKKEAVELKRKLSPKIIAKIEDNKIVLGVRASTKKEKRTLGSLVAHIKNIFRGLNEKFKYRLQAVSVHFPMTVSIDKEKNQLVVKNFLGEKIDRKINLVKNTEVKVIKDIIEIESENIEAAGQCAANIEKGTKIRNRDRRVYQDGIYIIEKPGRSLL